MDAAFLRVESPNAHMHVGWLSLLELPAGREELDVEALHTSISGRLQLVPRFRQVVRNDALGLGEPVWLDDPDFDQRRHVIVERLAPDAGPGALAELCGRFLSRQLDRSRPLWELLIVPSLGDARAAMIGKVHHAMVDGVAAVELGTLLFDLDAAGSPTMPPVEWQPEPAPRELDLTASALADGAIEQFRALRGAIRMGLAPRETMRVADTMRRSALSLAEQTLSPAPPCLFNTAIGPRRALHVRWIELAPVEAIKCATGSKLNDVILAAIAGALRRFLTRSRAAAVPLRVMVPVSMRGGAGTGTGNRISFGLISLPTHEPTPLARLAAVRAAMAELKRSGRVGGADLLLRSLAPLPGPLKDRAARMTASPRLFNLTISNVPGPRTSLYAGGARIAEIHPVIPLAEGHALAIGALTYAGGLHVAVHADPDALPAAGQLPDLIALALTELGRAVSAPSPAAEVPPLASAAGAR